MSQPGSDDARSASAALSAVVRAYLEADAASWWAQTLAAQDDPPDENRLRLAFARAGRKLGDGVVEPSPQLQHRMLGGVRPTWTLRDYGRAALLLQALATLPGDAHLPLVDRMFRRGEMGEQQSLLRILPVLPDPGRFSVVAAEATRSNAEDVFAALACDNPYPADHLPDLAFDQMVMKAIFVGLPVSRIERLGERVTAELVRMARDYASERQAAGRPVPEDVAVLERLLEERS